MSIPKVAVATNMILELLIATLNELLKMILVGVLQIRRQKLLLKLLAIGPSSPISSDAANLSAIMSHLCALMSHQSYVSMRRAKAGFSDMSFCGFKLE